jgi:hypothetical protein
MADLRASTWGAQGEAGERAETLEARRAAAWVLARALGRLLLRQVLEAGAVPPQSWPHGKACGRRLQSKGWAPRRWTGSVGTVRGKRRVGRCPGGCRVEQVAPLERALGLEAYTRTSGAREEMACRWAGFGPFPRVCPL